MKNRFLVTGGAGFIGSHITEALVKKGRDVKVLDNFSSGREENLSAVIDKVTLIKGDIRSKDTCLKVTRGIDFVLHQAALRSVPKSFIYTGDYNDVNIQGTLNLLEASVKNKVKVFVFASSSSVYGEVKVFPEREDSPPSPISPYALTKLVGEYYCRIFSHSFGLPTISLRYFNVFGPRQALDDEYAIVIPKFITCLLKNEPAPIYGTGRQSRDFTYVQNVVTANILAAERHNGKGETFNIASGKDYSILELLKTLNKLMQKDIKPHFLDRRPGDVFRTLADLSRSKKLLGFEPKIDFIKGLKSTVEYFRENA
ncbi:MAG: SDR family oxidoreductase [Candidatus Omnitrophica bacterium]|nr:SDR family oxidoreductase [Candidatus Omnitrophota bacterium]